MEITGVNSIQGEIKIPGDKSISHRSAIMSALTKDTVIINNFLFSQDCMHTLESLKAIGLKIEKLQDKLIISGGGINNFVEPDDILYVGNSGTTIRLMCGLLSATKKGLMFVLSGDSSINKRPMERVIAPLTEMGASIFGSKENTRAPIVIFGSIGKLKGAKLNINVSSAQVKSCIALAALFADGQTEIIQPEKSRDHTERMLEYFGADILYDGKNTIIKPGKELNGRNLFIPSDLSSAAFFIVASLILKKSRVILKNIGVNPLRSYFLDVLLNMGANIKIFNPRIINNEPVADIESSSSKLKGITLEKQSIPNIIDEVPALCVAAAFAEGQTIIGGAEELRFKESDRISSIASQFKKAGIDIIEQKDGMAINGNCNTNILGGDFDSYGDHRIAMALAVLMLRGTGKARILGSESIDTSFPGFIYELKKSVR